jgi:ABC-type antimicrobial peptide transport system permease subunit
MTDSFLYNLEASYLVTILFCLMLLVSYLGYKLSIKKNRKTIDNSTLLSSLLALFGLLLAFTFGMSGSRFDDRRKSIVDEVNCIGTAILRTDLYPDSLKKELKKDLLK